MAYRIIVLPRESIIKIARDYRVLLSPIVEGSFLLYLDSSGKLYPAEVLVSSIALDSKPFFISENRLL